MPQSAGIVPWQSRWRTWDKRGTNDEQRTGKADDGRGLNGLDHDELDQIEFEKKSGNEMTCLDGWMDGWMDASIKALSRKTPHQIRSTTLRDP